jgi:hypothetical protein
MNNKGTSVVYGLRAQKSRCLAPLLGNADSHSFLVGTNVKLK